jgi:hypothetical protein
MSSQTKPSLALLALSKGDPMRAHGWLCFFGHEERLSMFPLYRTRSPTTPNACASRPRWATRRWQSTRSRLPDDARA